MIFFVILIFNPNSSRFLLVKFLPLSLVPAEVFCCQRAFKGRFFGIISALLAYIHNLPHAPHQKIYNFDISGESNQRNKFVKCFEHYFLGRKFIVYVQLSPSHFFSSLLHANPYTVFLLPSPQTRNKIKIFDPRRGWM